MNILLIEPYYTGSHKTWADEFKKYSSHNIQLLTLSGNFWKWRMHGGAITLAKQYEKTNFCPDLILATDMLDLTSFLSLTRKKTANIPTAMYFHENQLAYPWSPIDRDMLKKTEHHYSFINYISSLTADKVFFNSGYHKNIYLKELTKFLKMFPDHNELQTVETIRKKSDILYLGLDLLKNTRYKPKAAKNKKPLILWNHRWEHDKNPEDFINALITLDRKKIDFEVAFLGECFNTIPDIFLKAKKEIKRKIVHFGFAENYIEYIKWLWKADIIPVTSRHDFFGASVVQAIYCDCIPLLPERLTYPELIPVKKYADNYYRDQKEFIRKLEKMILNIENYRTAQQNVTKFDWSNIISEYDRTFGCIAQQS